ncbi:MAG: hypothetical protein QM278_07740 [Pseudomonadota bacterium]|nr:hypothetical protein [Pseudomonadota bacterium]
MKRKRFAVVLWCMVLVMAFGWGNSWAGPFDSLTSTLKDAVKTQVEDTSSKAKSQTGDTVRTATPAVRGPAAGNIIFSKAPIDPGNPTQLTDEFKVGDPIYAAACLGKSIRVLNDDQRAKKVYVEISFWKAQKPLYDYQKPREQFIGFSAVNLTGGILDKDVLPFEILPLADGMKSYSTPEMAYKKFGTKSDGPVKIADSLAKLETGRHTIIFKVKINYKEAATGNFNIEGTDFAKLASLAEDYRKAEVAQATANAEMPKAAMNDRKLEAEMIAVLKSSRTFKDRMKGQILRLVIIDPDWTVRRHALTGVILHRYIRAAAAIKDAGGACRIWNLITFQQDYVGGRYQKTRFDGAGDPTPILCENIK